MRAPPAAAKPTFRRSFAERRCVVPANGFFEWRRAAGQKVPYHLCLSDGGLYGMAGLWTVESDDQNRPLESFVVAKRRWVAAGFAQGGDHIAHGDPIQ